MPTLNSIRAWSRRIKRDGVTLWFAYRHVDTPWAVKGLCIFVVAYALSPIDLIPDFIPILGHLDDVILLPILIWLAVRMLPMHVVTASRGQADTWMAEQRQKPKNYIGAAGVVIVWCALLYFAWKWWPL